MNKKDLYKAIGDIDDDLIEDAKTIKPRNHLKKYIGIAACFAVAVISAIGVLNSPRNIDIATPKPDASLVNSSDNSGEKNTLTLNNATGEMAKDMRIKGHFWEDLTQEEINKIYVGISSKYPITARVDYSKQDDKIDVFQITAQVAINNNITATVKVAPHEVVNCYILDGEPILSIVDNISVNAGYFGDTNNGKIIYYASFKIDDVAYYIELAGEKEDQAVLLDLITEIIQGEKADLSILNPTPPKLVEERLTLEAAYLDLDFGKYIPKDFPDGYLINTAYRFINQEENYLFVSLSKGLEDINWQVSYISEEDKSRITSVADTKNYNLKLYPIPRYDSVPKELREIVDDPIFKIEDLTLEAIDMRNYTMEDAGGANGEMMGFSVLYGDVLVRVDTEGIKSTELYNMLMSK